MEVETPTTSAPTTSTPTVDAEGTGPPATGETQTPAASSSSGNTSQPRPEDVPLDDTSDDLDDLGPGEGVFPKRRLTGKQSGYPERAVRRRLELADYAEALAVYAPEAAEDTTNDYALDPNVPADWVDSFS